GENMAPSMERLASVCYLFVLCTLASAQQNTTESVLLNLTALSDINHNKYNVQINLSLLVMENETMINGYPVKPSAVTRITCPAVLCKTRLVTMDSFSLSDGLVSSELRLMLNQSAVQSDAGELLLSLILSHEIIQLADEKVQQEDAGELEILWDQSSEQILQLTNLYPSSGSKLALIPRENDVLVTDSSTVEEQIRNTTSHYLLKHAETTQEEVAAPGKLPETPLRMDPQTLYLSRQDERTFDPELFEETLRGTMSSYSVVCQWVEELRQKLRLFWSDSVPLFFLVMWVVVVGVAGSAVIIKILDL
ncbi:hypothetical protein DNTS_006528, partial [Danionella cerebrum]